MKRILVTGANSYIGTSFRSYIRGFGPGYQADGLSLRDEGWRDADFSGYDALLHTVGLAHVDRGRVRERDRARYEYINVELAAAAAEKAKAAGIGQFIYLSSAIVYGDSSPVGGEKRITRATPVSPSNCYGASKVRGEEALRRLETASFGVAILRLPMVYGPGSRGNYPLLAKLCARTPVFPAVENRRSMLYIENLCEFLRLAVEHGERGTFWPQNAAYVCTSDMASAIAAAHGRRLRLVGGLTPALRAAGHVTGLVNRVFGSLTYDRSLSAYREDYQVCSFAESIRRSEGGRGRTL